MSLENRFPPFREVAKSSLKNRVDQFSNESPLYPIAKAILDSPIDWERTGGNRQAKQLLAGTVAALHYAYLETGNEHQYASYRTEKDPQRMAKLITTVLDDPTMNPIFYENLGRPYTSISPSRGIPVQYICRRRFGDQPISGAEFGAGGQVLWTQFNKPRFIDSNFPGKNALVNVLSKTLNVNITTGLAIDKQDVRKDVNWAKAALWPVEDKYNGISIDEVESLVQESADKQSQFPFLLADVADPACLEMIQRTMQSSQLDVCATLYVRHELNPSAQNNLLAMITKLLRVRGLWIDIGEELMHRGQNISNNKVRVFEKTRNNRLELIGEPFILKNQRDPILHDLNAFLRI